MYIDTHASTRSSSHGLSLHGIIPMTHDSDNGHDDDDDYYFFPSMENIHIGHKQHTFGLSHASHLAIKHLSPITVK